MLISNLLSSIWDEKTWNLDSGVRGSSLYKIQQSETSYGTLGPSDLNDYYQVTPGLGRFRLVVTSDPLNAVGFAGTWGAVNSSFRVRVTDATGTVLFEEDSAAADAYTDTISFTSTTTTSYWVEITNLAGSTFRYAATLQYVGALNQAPTAASGSATTAEDTRLTGSLPVASDPDGDGVTYTKTTEPSNGVLTISANGTYTYTPNLNFNGTDSFRFTVSDGRGGSNTYTQTITITPVNDAPVLSVAIPDRRAVVDTTFTYTVPATTFSDVDSSVITFAATLSTGEALPSWLTFNATTRTFTGKPTSAQAGSITVAVIGSDGSLTASDLFVISIGLTKFGGSGNDTLEGSIGDDYLYGGTGDDRYIGGGGDDYLYDSGGNNFFDGGNGNDTIVGDTGADTVTGGAGNDFIAGWSGDDSLEGGAGNDSLYGNDGNDSLSGGDGDDSLEGGSGNDSSSGGSGVDRILTGDGVDYVEGGDGNDEINGYPVDSSGRYTYFTYSGIKTIYGNGGDDFLFGGASNDSIFGGEGADRLYGFSGNDFLDGGTGNDRLEGGDGSDTLNGATGTDQLYGGDGDDVYYIANQRQYVYDSGGIDTAYVSANFVKVPSSIEKVVYVGSAQALPYWIDALTFDSASGSAFSSLLGTSQTFYYTFPSVIPSYYAADPEDSKGWAPFSAAQQARALVALDYISSVVNLKFSPALDSNAGNTIAFANNDQSESAGYARIPSSTAMGSDLFLDNSNSGTNSTLADGTYGAYTFIHELGHAIGLKHPFSAPDAFGGDVADPPYLPGPEDSTRWTVMSYTSSSTEYFIRFSALDIAALHYLYGPSPTSRAGNDAYTISTTEANFIWDGVGTDTITAASCDQGCTIYLTPGYWGYVGAAKATYITSPGQITVNFGSVIENLVGSGFSDRLFGNEVANSITGGAGDDSIEGGEGNDTLQGGQGNDTLFGGDGDTDVAVFQGNLANYAFISLSGGQLIRVTDTNSSRDGIDTVSGVEVFRFADGDRTKAQILALGNAAPVATNAAATTAEETPLSGSLPSATDADGDSITYSKASDPRSGSVTVASNGAYTYTPSLNFNGTDSFSYAVSDGRGGTNTYTITLTVTPVNDPPTARNDNSSTPEDTTVTGQLPPGTDVDGDAVTYSKATDPRNGTVTISATGLATYTPRLNFNGTDAFNYTVSDGKGGSNTYTITMIVTPVNDAPSLASALPDQTAAVGAPFSWVVPSSAFVDVDGDPLQYAATLSDGKPLPAWLSFDSSTRTFSGTPLVSDEGTVSVRVSASDSRIATSDVLDIAVAGGQLWSGTSAADTFTAGVGRDTLSGGAGNDTLGGGAGNDLLTGGAGDDRLDGGLGTDTASFAARASGYRLLFKDGTFQVQDRSGLEGLDTLVSVERLQFSDKSIVIESRDHGSFADLPSTMYQFFILAFGAAPGVEYLQQCADAYRSGASVKVITNVFTSKSQFTDIYPTSLSNRDMATKLVTNVVGTSATQAARDEAIRDITGALDNGLSRGDMIFTVFSNLATLKGDAKWGGTAQLFFNQIAVAKYYTETMNQSTTDRATLAAAISAVTATSDVSTDAAVVTLIGQGLLGGGGG